MYIQLFKLLIRFHLTFCRTNRLYIIFLLFLNCFRRTRNTGHQWKIAPLFFSIRTSFGCCCYKGCIPFLTFKLCSTTTLHLLDIIKYYFLDFSFERSKSSYGVRIFDVKWWGDLILSITYFERMLNLRLMFIETHRLLEIIDIISSITHYSIEQLHSFRNDSTIYLDKRI